MFHHIYILYNVPSWTQVGEYRKIPAFGLRSTLVLCVRVLPQPHANTPLLLSRYRHSTVQQIYNTVQYTTLQYSTVEYSTVQYSTLLYSTVEYSRVEYSTVQYTTFLTSLQTMSSPCSFRCLVKSPQYFLCKDTFLYSFTVFLEKGVFYIQFYSISWKKACFLYSLTIFPGKEAFIYNLTEFPGKVIFSI